MKATARAHTNIALIKYWGKRNESLILPANSNLSVTLDGFSTETTVHFQEDLKKDIFLLNEQNVEGNDLGKVAVFLDKVRALSGNEIYAQVQSVNHVPTAAGFASSASGLAALAAASAKAIGLSLDDTELSKLARQGSGSACRSIYGGFVEWQMGEREDGADSFAVQVADRSHWDIRIAAVVLSKTMKKVSSREGMRRTVETSPFYAGWLEQIPKDLQEIKQAIADKDFEKMGSIAEANCLRMHATTLGANPPFTYWQDTTMRVMQTVQSLREQGVPAFFTIDAGPNVKVLYLPEDEDKVKKRLHSIEGVDDIIISKPGNGISYL
ncbi:diphosphomevalonate decarboxylase [Oceanobacillus neutriphilus]|uniref:diphosphomevalonate decarboxylase n=1 Tax=Oceanobacillus neutriphilus TaxID=531815 RepID=A0ABQ2P1X2_9BACI|nr:diphosphomevalonate decarboxylase [Oceanobacillus neutriphilus]GGP16187.1 diphosphomevalonate decarboxylase [Oceanobacillus neutriphilus]